MTPSDPEPNTAPSQPEIEPAQLQFIEQVFHEYLSDRAEGASFGSYRDELIRWIHGRLFVNGAPVASVFSELNQSRRRARVIAVTSGKGGVGKTTFAVNLAVAFAHLRRRVLLFDGDLGMANVHIFAGVNPKATLLDVVDRRATFDEVLIPGPAGIQMICGASGIGRMADLNAHVLESLGRELLRVAADYDVLIIDTGAGISPMVTHFLSLANDAIVVTTPNLASTLDAYGVIKLVHENQLAARMHVLINEAEEEHQAARVLDRITACANRFLKFSLSSLGFLGRDPAFEQSNQSRRPLLLTDPANINAQRIIQIAVTLLGQPAAAADTAGQPSDEHAAA